MRVRARVLSPLLTVLALCPTGPVGERVSAQTPSTGATPVVTADDYARAERFLGGYTSPLVLHGASSVPKDLVEEINKYGGKLGTDAAGVPEQDIEVARRTGCTKVNIDTDLRLAMTAAIRRVFAESPKEFDPRKYLGPARARVKALVRHKVSNVLCCAGHAFD